LEYTLLASRLLTPIQVIKNACVVVEDGRIARLGPRDESAAAPGKTVEIQDGIVAPGFVDIHIHGGGGHDVMEANEEALSKVETLLAEHGVTSYLPTTVTASLDATLRALEGLAQAIERARDRAAGNVTSSRARPLGIHLEGPFISHARRGVHPPNDLLPPRIETFDRFWQAARGQIRMMTIAPELEGARELIAEATRRGVTVSLGHSDATLEQSEVGIAAGARHATHTFNAMRPLGHRDPGILGVALGDDRLTADVIADGIHLDPIILRLFLRAKGPERAVLITDAIAATGMPDGRYHLGQLEVDVKDGKCVSDGKLAGSVLTMDRAVRNTTQIAGWDLQTSVRLATMNAARVVREGEKRGELKEGLAADFIVLDQTGRVLRTIVGGHLE
jgi:N-acetylglucosamine-6-phosphate deacetylase